MNSGSKPLATTRKVNAGGTIFRYGDPGDCAYVIDAGEVEIFVEVDGQRQVVSRLGPGKLFGEMAIIDHRARMASAEAATDCVLTVITIEQLQTRLDLLDPVLRLCLDTITGRLRKTMEAGPPLVPGNDVADANVSASFAVNRIRLENELRIAIDDGQLRLYLQPILDLHRHQIVGFESLVRWQHPRDGLIGPDEFIPIAESSGMIRQITQWVLGEACRARTEMLRSQHQHSQTLEKTFISVNLSATDLTNPDLCKELLALVSRHNFPAHYIKLEITESLLMSAPDTAAATLGECRERGFQVAIDDFGTGFASFGYLQQFAVDGLKIDRRFINSLATAAKDRAIVGSMINLATSLEIPVIAEGIEEQCQADVLAEMGCDFVQGFLYARPRPWQDLIGADFSYRQRRVYDRKDAEPALTAPGQKKTGKISA